MIVVLCDPIFNIYMHSIIISPKQSFQGYYEIIMAVCVSVYGYPLCLGSREQNPIKKCTCPATLEINIIIIIIIIIIIQI